MSTSEQTTDHRTIQRWAEERNGHPAVVRTEGEGGVLRIDFDEAEDGLEAISWEEFFEIFDNSKLSFLYQDKTAEGGTSRFNKFVNR
jgi:hypothetical protein